MMNTFILAIMLTSLFTIIGLSSILFGLRFIINRLAELEICTNIYEAQLKKLCEAKGYDFHKVTSEEIVHAFDDFIKKGDQEE